ncbi:MAG: ComEC/Rec2 family competence protein [Spirochaetes bacterium]|nr:ComEC/Rec2 family competence protein [Spirochaetota bacterium]
MTPIDARSAFSLANSAKSIILQRGYAGLPQKVFTPSLILFTSVSAATLLACSAMLEGRASRAGMLTLAFALASFPLVYINSLRGVGHRAWRRTAARAMVLLALSAACCACTCLRIARHGDGAGPVAVRSEWTAQVIGVVRKRYYQEAEIGLLSSGSRAGRGDFRRGLLRVTGIDLAPGDLIRFGKKPAAASASLPVRRSLLLRGIRAVWYLDGGDLAIVKRGSSLREAARTRLASNCDELFGRNTAAVVKALYFGNKDYIDRITVNDFKRAGVLHVLAASGLHVGVVAAIPLFLLGLIRVNRKIIIAVAALAVFGYLCITDMPVSLLRACVMFFIYAAQRLAGRDVNIFNTLFLSATVIVMTFPGELYGLGFQLSFGATLGILLFHGLYRKAFSWLPDFLSNPLALTMSAQVIVFPVILARTGEVNLAGPLSNIIIVPLMSLLLVVSIAANSLFFAASAVSSWAGSLADALYGLSLSVVRFISGLNGHLYVEGADAVLGGCFCLVLLPLIPGLRGRRIASIAVAAGFAAAWLAVAGGGGSRDAVTEICHGEGRLILITNGETVSAIGQYPARAHVDRIAREIAAAGREVNLYITRADYRNVSACSGLLKRLPVRRCYLSGGFRIKGYTRRFFDLLQKDGVELLIHGGTEPGGPARLALPEMPVELAGLRNRMSAGVVDAADGTCKNIKIRYLTLH